MSADEDFERLWEQALKNTTHPPNDEAQDPTIVDPSAGEGEDDRTETEIPVVLPLTRADAHNADYLEHQFGKDVRFDHVRRKWYVWHKGQHHWREDDHEEVRHMTDLAARRRVKAAVDSGSKEKLSVAMVLLNLPAQMRAMEHLRFHPGVAVGQQHWDQNLDLFACRNGVIDLRDGSLRAGDRSDLITKCSPVRYDLAASAPRWAEFLKEVFVSDEMVAYVQSIVGYCMTGLTVEQVWFLLYGTGGNGKTVFVNVLESVFGVKQYYEAAAAETFVSNRYGSSGSHNIAQLRGARLVVASEVPERASFDGARIKALTGSDPVTAAAKYENNMTFVPQLKLMMLVNHLPSTRDDSLGFWRRLRPIPFDVSFTDAPDVGLQKTLLGELPGILNWCIEGAVGWYANGLAPEPAAASQLKTDYKAESDPLAMFVHECVVETGDPNDTVGSREAYRIYENWCRETKRVSMTETNFGRSSAMLGLGSGRKKLTAGNVYTGIKVFEPGSHPVSGVRNSGETEQKGEMDSIFGSDD